LALSEPQAVIGHCERRLSRLLAPRFAIRSAFDISEYEKCPMLRRRLGGRETTQGAGTNPSYKQLKSACNPSLLSWNQLFAQYGIDKKQAGNQNPFGAAVDDIRAFLSGKHACHRDV
jgi:hypothetical protein